MKLKYLGFFTICLHLLTSMVLADNDAIEPHDGLKVKDISITVENQTPAAKDESQKIYNQLQTQVGEPFDQERFDEDLKHLSSKYEWVEPKLTIENHELVINLVVKTKPIISAFEIEGGTFPKRKILREGELKTGMEYDRSDFYKSINKIRDFLIKKGYFKAEVSYTIDRVDRSNEAIAKITIDEGPRGRIQKITFHGFTSKEEREVMNLIRSRKFNILTSWLTGSGTIKQDEIDGDVQSVVHYFQTQGYVDAHVTMKIGETKDKRLELVINLERGPKYHIRDISFSNYSIKSKDQLEEAIDLKPGSVYSIDHVRQAQEKLKELYSSEGYLDTNVDYKLVLVPNKPEYDIEFDIEESEKYRVGLVIISGNFCTNKNVIYNNITLQPGEVFDSRKLKSTQDRLRSTGYFKNANVYAVKGADATKPDSTYRDVMVEVEEKQTGTVNLFVGFNSTDSIFGGVDIGENNFNLSGLKYFWRDGPCSLRGGGEFLQIRGTAGARDNEVNISWLNPYFNDTLWRFGVETGYKQSSVPSRDYNLNSINFSANASYPVNPAFSAGTRWRIRDDIISISKDASDPAREQRLNSGIVTGVALLLGYDSTDHPIRPHRGYRSNFEAEFAGLVRRVEKLSDFPFTKVSYLNSIYLPIWRKGTLKLRGDVRFIQPLWGGKPNDFPLNERFFLGGESTVRGYTPASIGPAFPTTANDDTLNPTGGVSSQLLSIEYAQNIFRPIDLFVFFDGGAISLKPWRIESLKMSYGGGVRLDIGQRLPVMVGYGKPINPANSQQVQGLFFSMAGTF